MKNGYIKKIAAVTLAAVMMVTTVPALSLVLNPAVTAEAKTKKKAKKKARKKKENEPKSSFYVNKDIANGKAQENGYILGVGKFNYYGWISIYNRKPKAKYTFTTNSKNLSVKYNVKNDEFTITAKKAGKYKITGKEKYKGKTRNLGTKTVKAYEPKLLTKSITAYKEDVISAEDYLDSTTSGLWKHTITEGKDLIRYDKDHSTSLGDGIVVGGKAGTAKVQIKDYYGKKIGTLTINVLENHVNDIKLNPENKDGIKTDPYEEKKDDDYDEDDIINISDYFNIYTDRNPEGVSGVYSNLNDDITIESANPSVFTVTQTTNDEGRVIYEGRGVAPGQTTVEVSANGHSLSIPVLVYSNSCTDIISSNGIDSDREDYDFSTIRTGIADEDAEFYNGTFIGDYYAICTDKYPEGYYFADGKAVNNFTKDKIEVTSADPSIFEVSEAKDKNEEDAVSGWYGLGRSNGDTTITVTCNGHSLTIPVHVDENYNEDYGDDEDY